MLKIMSILDKSLKITNSRLQLNLVGANELVMTCQLFGAKPLPEPMLTYGQLDP